VVVNTARDLLRVLVIGLISSTFLLDTLCLEVRYLVLRY